MKIGNIDFDKGEYRFIDKHCSLSLAGLLVGYPPVEVIGNIHDNPELMELKECEVALARYCNQCADNGNGCETCKINEFAVFCGINEPLNEE
jgi:hypothetical protein